MKAQDLQFTQLFLGSKCLKVIADLGKNTPERQDYIIENLREDVDKQIEAPAA